MYVSRLKLLPIPCIVFIYIYIFDNDTLYLLQCIGDPIMSKKSSLFAEAIILPFDLLLHGEHGQVQVTEALKDEQKEHNGYYRINYPKDLCNKRPKHGHTSNAASTSSSKSITGISGRKPLNCPICGVFAGMGFSNDHKPNNFCLGNEIHCVVLPRSLKNCRQARAGSLLCANNYAMDGVVGKSSARKVLLEFKSETFSMYQVCWISLLFMLLYKFCGRNHSTYVFTLEHYKL